MDAIDRKILGLLLEDAGRTYAQLGREVSLSPAAVHERVRRLRASGVVRRTTVEVDPDALGRHVLAFVLVDSDGWVKDELSPPPAPTRASRRRTRWQATATSC